MFVRLRILISIVVLVLVTVFLSFVKAATAASAPRPLVLSAAGDARSLPERLFGGSTVNITKGFMDPAEIAALTRTAPADLRFPGGSQSNYYNWRTGLFNFDEQSNSSIYLKFWAVKGKEIAQHMPDGVHMEQYALTAQKVGAEVILVPNLETSTVDEQVAWFKQLAAEHILPSTIELGNEFYIAMGGDPASLKRWPDEATAMAVMQKYQAALRPIVGPGARFAVQAAASAFNLKVAGEEQRRLAWDAALSPAPWFDAVTVHIYADPTKLVTTMPNASNQQLFDLFMAHADAGVDRVLDDTAKHLPGKEIWITEWSPRGDDYNQSDNPNYHELVPPPMRAQLIARYELAFLRHPEVTKALYFEFNLADKVFQEYVKNADGTYVPMDTALVLQWFDEAANGGSTFQRMVEPSTNSVSGGGPFTESYRQIEGGLFKSDKQTVLLLQNASAEARLYDPSQGGSQPWPSEVDVLDTSNLTAQAATAAQVTMPGANQPIIVPAYSIVRLIWR